MDKQLPVSVWPEWKITEKIEKDLSVKFIKLVEVSRERHFILRLSYHDSLKSRGIKQRSF